MACVKQAVVRHLPAIDATEGKDEVAVLCDKLCDDIRAGLLEAIDKACPGQPAYLLGGIQINGPTEGPELLAIRHFELRSPDGTLTDKIAALERALGQLDRDRCSRRVHRRDEREEQPDPPVSLMPRSREDKGHSRH